MARVALLVIVPSLLAFAWNILRPDGLPWVADTNYIDEILVPCPENLEDAQAIAIEELPLESSELVFVDARAAGAFLAGHIPESINIPHRPFNVDELAHRSAILADIEPLRGIDGERIVVCGDPQVSSGRDFASVLLENGFTHVRYLRGGCAAWAADGRPWEASAGQITAVRPEELAGTIDGLAVVDARFSRYYRRGHLPGAICITYAMLGGLDDPRLDPIRDLGGRGVLVYGSRDGSEGESLAQELASGGWSDLRILEGGFEAWQDAGYPVETSPTEGSRQ